MDVITEHKHKLSESGDYYVPVKMEYDDYIKFIRVRILLDSKEFLIKKSVIILCHLELTHNAESRSVWDAPQCGYFERAA